MKKLLKTLAAGALLVQASAVFAQSNPAGDPFREGYYKSFAGKTVAFLTILHAVDLSQGWYNGLKNELEPLGVKVVLRDANLNTNTGAQAFTQLLAEKPAVIVVQNPDLTAYGRLIKRAEAEGIHIISINMRSTTGSAGYVGPDWQQLGELQAEAAVKACKGKSNKISIVQGSLTSAASSFGMIGTSKVLAAHPEIKVVSNQVADWDVVKAKAITQAVLKQHPDICAVIGGYDGMDLGIGAAIKEAGLTGKAALVTSGGGTQATACDQVKAGTFDTYISYDVPTQVTQLNTLIKALINSGTKGGTFKSNTYSPLRQITKANADASGMCWKLGA